MVEFEYQDKIFKTEIIRKNNKNTYIRVKDDKVIVTTNYLVSNKQIEKLIYDNKKSIIRMIKNYEQKNANSKIFKLFGKEYDIIYGNLFSKVEVSDNKIFACDEKKLARYLKKYIEQIFKERLLYNYNLFEEKIPYPDLRIRKMKTRWGVCNTKRHIVTLNLELSRYEICYLDYVIIHELSHLIYPNHQKEFWMLVGKYCKNYKVLRKNLRN